MTKKKIPADKYVKKRRSLKLWHRMLLAAGCVVVFVTTYMLILPAITAEIGSIELFDESVSSGSSITPDEETFYIEETTEEITEELTEEITEENTEAETDGISEETSDYALEETTETTAAGGSSDSSSSEEGLVDEKEEENTSEEVSEDSSEVSTDTSTEETTSETAETGEIGMTAENIISFMLEELGIEIVGATSGSGTVTLDDGTTVTYRGSGTNNSYNCEYDSDTGNFSVDLGIDFVLSLDALNNASVSYNDDILNGSYYGVYSIDLPDGIIVPDKLLNNRYEGVYSGTTTVLFDLYFEEYTDGEGNTKYRVIMGFLDSQITGQEETITGTITLEAYVNSETNYTKDGDIVVSVGDVDVITIDSEDITFTGNETVNNDITVTKSGSYNTTTDANGNIETAEVSYTVMVYTKKGTGDTITLTDSFTTEFASGVLGDLTSLTVSKGTNTAYVYWEGEADNFNDSEYSEEESAELVPASYTGTAYSYTYDSDGNLVITLPGLDDVGDETILDSSDWRYSSEEVEVYYITYTYEVDPQYVDSTGVNSVTASTHDDTAGKM